MFTLNIRDKDTDRLYQLHYSGSLTIQEVRLMFPHISVCYIINYFEDKASFRYKTIAFIIIMAYILLCDSCLWKVDSCYDSCL